MTTLRQLPKDTLERLSKHLNETPSLDIDINQALPIAWLNHDFVLVKELENAGATFSPEMRATIDTIELTREIRLAMDEQEEQRKTLTLQSFCKFYLSHSTN